MGQIIVWILLCLLALIILVLLLPASVQLHYAKEKFTVKIRVLLIRVQVFPFRELSPEKAEKKEQRKKNKEQRKKNKEQRKKEKEEKKRKKKNENPEKEIVKPKEVKKKKTIEEWLIFIQEMVGSGTKASGFVLKHLRMKNVAIFLPVQGSDPAETVIEFGIIQGLLYSVTALLANFATIKYRKVEIIPDFMGQYENKTTFSCNIDASPIIIIIAGIIFIRQYSAKKKQRKENYRAMAKQIVLQRRANKRARQAAMNMATKVEEQSNSNDETIVN